MSSPIVTVRGEAQLEGPPDLASFSFTVHRRGSSAEDVQAALAEASGQVRGVLSGFDTAIERSSSSGLHVAPDYGPRDGSRVRGYRGTFSTEVVVHDFSALSALVFALEPIPDTQGDGPWWSLRPDNPMFRRARLEAIGDARRRADDYAEAFGAAVNDLVEVSDLEGGFAGPRGRAMAAERFAMSSGPEQPIFEFEPALQTVSGQVTVRFSISAADLTRPPAP
ncbi:MAG: SIMPL domain-containing protein [Propionibacteriaceae bacterium]|nr:SIMPL domain-containing protein [Propionibacteriaceae bacterium]